ncbi:MAG: alpha/beta hydrolase, partial [Saccharospirillaceae bacterium]|nr:hypothetical protein [Pseudomonadales bacterium]NRB81121.1 alpha/beta hydrolase [Saccharospirillaceae bacterium]
NIIIRMAIEKVGVHPNRVYLIGYSAGGDGAYQMGVRMADRWAGVGMMAGHPNATKQFSLANTPFNLQVGGNDSAYNRNTVGQAWGDILKELAIEHPGLYINKTTIHPGLPHWMDGLDAPALPWMHQYTRDPIPTKVIWQQNNPRRSQLFWVGVPLEFTKAKERISVEYDYDSNTINIIENYSEQLVIWLNDDMMDLDQPVIVQYQGVQIFEGEVVRSVQNIYDSSVDRADSTMSFSAQLKVSNNAEVEVAF